MVLNFKSSVLVHFDVEFFFKSGHQFYTLHGVSTQVKDKIGSSVISERSSLSTVLTTSLTRVRISFLSIVEKIS